MWRWFGPVVDRVSDVSPAPQSRDGLGDVRLTQPRDELAFIPEEQVDMSCLHVGDDDPDLPRGEPPLLPSCSRQRERACEPRGLEELRSVPVGHETPNAHSRCHRYGSRGRTPPKRLQGATAPWCT